MGARPVGYEVSASGPKGTSLLKKTMAIQGLVVLVFVVWHLITFKYGVEYEIQYGDTKMRDLFRLVHETFQNQFYAIWYVVAVSILCAHVAHGFHSGLQTLGLNHPKYESLIHKTSVAFGLLVTAMFISQPIYMGFFFKG
jgi:succinate dehydrogenase / fumarate reductase cytochrome b subunit